MRGSRYAIFSTCVANAFFLSGCDPQIYRGQTTLKADGSVSRAVYQPSDGTWDSERNRDVWKRVTYAARIPHERWSGDIAQLPLAVHDEKHPYVAAWGDFESPAKLPPNVVKQGLRGLPDGKLVVEYAREDCVFVVEHRWKETLTDIVTLDDMHRARQELADLLIPLAQKILDEALGDEYQTANPVDWLKGTATPWFFEMTDAVFEMGARKRLSLEEKSEKSLAMLATICERHGLRLRDEAGKLLDGNRFETAVRTYAAQVLRDNLRRRDGEKVPDEVIDELLEWIGGPTDTDGRGQRYEQAAEKVVSETFGGNEALAEALVPLVARILGHYWPGLFENCRQFHYTLETPGPIVETNGALLSDHRVRWTFEATDAFPLGYAMECRSLTIQSELEKELLGRSVFENRETVLQFVNLVRSSDALRETLRDCAAAHGMAPLYKARDKSAPASTADQSFNALIKVLKLPKEPEKESLR
ncbi:MAG: hypothetical protein HY288_07215 [Planctomycetia bacterium]|nr:hypothetical protein [Planctomycetia bacterium]